MKNGGSFKLREIGLRSWEKFVAGHRLDGGRAFRKDPDFVGTNA